MHVPGIVPGMASISKRPDSKYWRACWTGSDGKRRKRSTKTSDKRLAEKLARQFEEESRSVRTARQARSILSTIYRDLSGEELPAQSVSGYVEAFLKRKQPEVTPATFAYYRSNATRFVCWLGAKASEDLTSVTRAQLTDYRNHLANQVAGKTANHSLQCIKSIFSEARKDGFISENPGEFVDSVRSRTEQERRPFKLPELRAVLAAADGEWRSMILFAFYTGQRLGDVALLRWSNLDLERGELRLVTQKTGRRLQLPLAPPLLAHLGTLAGCDDPNAPLHPRASASVARTGRAGKLSNEFGSLLVSAGLRLPVPKNQGKGRTGARTQNELSFHSLRHTATSCLKEAGIPPSVVMDYIGHDSAQVSQGYTHTGREALQRAAAAMPSL